LRHRLAERFELTFTRVHSGLSLEDQAATEGPNLWSTSPDRCCFIRKVLPLRRFLSTRSAWITGIRRDQSPTRKGIGIVSWDAANGLVKINPLARWTESDVWAYIRRYDLPYNPLHDEGYPSIGCIPCTRQVADGEDARAGRWRGHEKLECGIHVQDASLRKTA
jgi:phosphoadenosine phosphosulfate reductase